MASMFWCSFPLTEEVLLLGLGKVSVVPPNAVSLRARSLAIPESLRGTRPGWFAVLVVILQPPLRRGVSGHQGLIGCIGMG